MQSGSQSAFRPAQPRLLKTQMSTPPRATSWNPDLAVERLGGDRVLFLDLMRIFLDEAPGQLQALRKAVETGNCGDAECAAHRLKGDLGYLNAMEAAGCARELEEAGHNGDLSRAGSTLAMLEARLEMILSAMRAACADR